MWSRDDQKILMHRFMNTPLIPTSSNKNSPFLFFLFVFIFFGKIRTKNQITSSYECTNTIVMTCYVNYRPLYLSYTVCHCGPFNLLRFLLSAKARLVQFLYYFNNPKIFFAWQANFLHEIHAAL